MILQSNALPLKEVADVSYKSLVQRADKDAAEDLLVQALKSF